MKIQLPSEKNGFQLHPRIFCGLESFLIVPTIDAIWTSENLYNRSLIVDSHGEVLSCGWPKFFNNGEQPRLYPDPEQFKDWVIQEKLDGSLAIVDFVNDTFSMRTRGCSTYTVQENHKDFEMLLEKYPKTQEFLKNHSHFSLLFEIVTPNNVIVIRPKEVEFYLLGAIDKNVMSVVSNQELLDIWRGIGCTPMPKTYQIDNVKNLHSIANLVKNWKGSEGVVVSYNKNQNRVKIKSDWYLWIHKAKSQLNSEDNLIDFYIQSDMPLYEDFYKLVETEFDYELAQQLDDAIKKVAEAGLSAQKHIDNLRQIIHEISNVETRKEQATMIKQHCKEYSAYAFSLLDEKTISKVQWTKLIKQKFSYES